PRGELEIIVCKPQFPSGEGCRRSGGVVCRGGNLPPVVIAACRDDRPRSSVVDARAGVFLCGYRKPCVSPWLSLWESCRRQRRLRGRKIPIVNQTQNNG
ncbi:MAG: hypothetical protein FWH14_08860, partial [Oscillospiraceae bacterium]|nr:hypothetical protein [Oscillospiraceae bacterium]